MKIDTLGHAQAHRMPVPGAAIRLGAAHWLAATLQATLPGGVQLCSTQCNATPGQRPGFIQARVPPPRGHGFAALYMWRAAKGRLPRGFVPGVTGCRSLVFR